MPAEFDLPRAPSGPQPARLKLVMPSSPGPPLSTPDAEAVRNSAGKESSGSPVRPSYSPVTPTLSQSGLALGPPPGDGPPQDQWMPEPEPLPVSLDDNADAIALRAAISILQMQRQQSLRDIRNLDKLKQAALQDPETFVSELQAGKLTSSTRSGVEVDHDDLDDDPDPPASSASSKFGKLPGMQNVVRAPPIEWAKYHITGEPLDKMHEVQRHYPGWTEDMIDAPQQPQTHSIATPYRPFTDKLDEPQTPRRQGDHGRGGS